MRWLCFVLAVVCVSCGGGSNPTAPSPPPPPPIAQISGAWIGTLTCTGCNTQAVRMTLSQTAGTVTGTWVNEQLGWAGNVSGTVDATSFTGTLTLNRATICTGTSGSFSGTASSSALRWSSAGFTGGNCPSPPSAVGLNLSKQ